MARLKKCVCCGEPIAADEVAIPYKKRYAHQRCFNASLKAIHTDKTEKLEKKDSKESIKKPKAELKDAMSEEEYKEKKKFYQYVRQLTGEKQLPAKIYALTNDQIKKYNFTYQGMYQTLVYLNEIVKKELEGDVVYIIPYYYSEAEKYYKNIKNIEEDIEQIDISNMYQTKTIYINPKVRKTKLIDITSIKDD
jgi:hypothetical protein